MLIRIVLIGFMACMGWLIHVADTGGSNFILETADAIPAGDKIGHFFMMGFLAYLVNLLLKCKSFKIGRFNILTGSVIVSVGVLMEEITQMFIRTRTFSYLDLLSDLLGIITFSILAVKTYQYFSQLPPEARPGRPA